MGDSLIKLLVTMTDMFSLNIYIEITLFKMDSASSHARAQVAEITLVRLPATLGA